MQTKAPFMKTLPVILKNGELIGVFTEWYENGKKKHEGRWSYGEDKIKKGGRDRYGRGQFWYENEKKDGLWIHYYENGQKWMEKNWKDGFKDGKSIEWYKK